jgi:hypothetical protein
MDSISDKTKKKNELQNLKESIFRVKSNIEVYKKNNNNRALKASIKVLIALELKLERMKYR